MSTILSRRGIAVLAAAGILVMVELAAVPRAEAATIYACVKKNGQARLFSKKPKCKKKESKLSWNLEGKSGKNGTNGRNGTNGTNGVSGTNGKEGAPGQPQKAVTFAKTLKVPGFLESEAAALFSIPGTTISAKITCFNFFANFNTIEAAAPAGTRAETGIVATNTEGKPPQVTQQLIKDVEVSPSGTGIATLSSNTSAPETNIGHLNGSLTSPGMVVLIDAFMEAGPNPNACTVRGTAFSIPT